MLLLFLFLGIAVGIVFGIIPGLHPNFLVVFAPLMFFSSTSEEIIVFVVAMSVSNVISDYIPSILFGAPEEGTELSVTPGHRMLLAGHGRQAIKLAVMGSVFSVLLICLLFPAIILVFPAIYSLLQPLLFFLLAAISVYMVLAQDHVIEAALCFVLSGIVGVSLHNFPIDASLALFPVLSGLFGASMLIVQFRQKVVAVKKQKPDEYVSPRLVKRSVLFGSLGGIFSGLLPGVGTSQVASLATVDKNEKSFLVTLGALATSNILISIVSLWLIGKARSGASIIIANYAALGFNDVLLILFTAVFAAGVAAIVTLRLSGMFLGIIEKVNYVTVSKIIFLVILSSVAIFSGFFGLFLFFSCTALGLFAYLSRIRMSCLMAVLIVPTMMFYFPF